MADISNELTTISEDVRGRNVKQAIYDALVKINVDLEQSSISGGNNTYPIGPAVVLMPHTQKGIAGYAVSVEEEE